MLTTLEVILGVKIGLGFLSRWLLPGQQTYTFKDDFKVLGTMPLEPFQHPILLWQSGLLPIPEDSGSNPVISRLERIIIKILIEKTENNEKDVLNLTCKTSYIIPLTFSRFKDCIFERLLRSYNPFKFSVINLTSN